MAPPIMQRIRIAWKALRQLGPARVAENGCYQFGLRLNWWQVKPPDPQTRLKLYLENLPAVVLPARYELPPQVLADADLALAGKARLYGGDPVPLVLDAGGPLRPWTEYERGHARASAADIKDVWEPSRFGWAVPLARGFLKTGDSRYAAAFWQAFETFQIANPAYLGPNWTSGQEAAIRVMVWAFILRALPQAPESTPERMARLAAAVNAQACRIPPTLIYARSQRNNHLLSEAAGLYTAGILLPGQPNASQWRKLGWELFNRAVQDQFDPDGAYIQQSINYHRLVLQEALWVDALARKNGERWPEASLERLAGAARWLLARVDPLSGGVPNFGHQDGADLFPFGEHSDFRPAAQAAARAFLGAAALPAGEWDSFSDWLDCPWDNTGNPAPPANAAGQPDIQRDSSGIILRSGPDWAMLRATRFHYRPGQSDQLHLDLWHHGQNIALDAGTYRYTAPAPWDNALASAWAHNSITIAGVEPMTRAGRFLWLDWDQAEIIRAEPGCVAAERMGYQKSGIRHRRTVCSPQAGEWRVVDELFPIGKGGDHTFVLHWLLPDWPWELGEGCLRLRTQSMNLQVETSASQPHAFQLIRAGLLLAGSGEFPAAAGWFSETYALKRPVLAYRLIASATAPITFSTIFRALDNP